MATDTKLHGLGRRKTAIAQVLLTDKPGEQSVNGKPFAEYFPTVAQQEAANEPLRLTSQDETFGFKAKITGGGKEAQSGALKLAIARALLVSDEGFRKQLKDTGTLTRDPRAKERKKPGLKRARRAPQFSKR
jgi:small subunit ribosomal protein S9